MAPLKPRGGGGSEGQADCCENYRTASQSIDMVDAQSSKSLFQIVTQPSLKDNVTTMGNYFHLSCFLINVSHSHVTVLLRDRALKYELPKNVTLGSCVVYVHS